MVQSGGKGKEEREKGQGQAVGASRRCSPGAAARLQLAMLCQQPGCSFWLGIATENSFFTEVFFPTIDDLQAKISSSSSGRV